MSDASAPPNILVFMTDDHGQWASSPYGAGEIVSPSLEFLARRGARMDRAFTPCPVCSPARASFWTGKIPSAHGVHDYLQEPGRCAHPGIWNQRNLAGHLHGAGYFTGLVGKWHCGHFWEPHDGFDVWFTNAGGTNARFGPQSFYEGRQIVEHHGHQAPIITDRAVRFLRERPPERPFFLFVGHTDTHTPHTAEPRRLVEHYQRGRLAAPPRETLTGTHGYARFAWPTSEAEARAWLADYYAAVHRVDEQVGRVLDELESRGELDNTLIVYTSDHGHMNGQHGLHTKGNATIPQNLLDESILVPLLISWPGRIAAGQARSELVDHTDLFATLLDAAGLDARALGRADRLPGRSYLPLLGGQAAPGGPWRQEQFCEYGNARMIRTAAAKLLRRYPGPNGHFPDEFYDLQADPREERNVLGNSHHAATVARLSAQLETHFAAYEQTACSGRDIARQGPFNEVQPWVLTPNGP